MEMQFPCRFGFRQSAHYDLINLDSSYSLSKCRTHMNTCKCLKAPKTTSTFVILCHLLEVFLSKSGHAIPCVAQGVTFQFDALIIDLNLAGYDLNIILAMHKLAKGGTSIKLVK